MSAALGSRIPWGNAPTVRVRWPIRAITSPPDRLERPVDALELRVARVSGASAGQAIAGRVESSGAGFGQDDARGCRRGEIDPRLRQFPE